MANCQAVPPQVIATPCYADYGYEYARQLPDGRLLLGAWRRPTADSGPVEADESLRSGLARFIRRYFPEVEGRISDRTAGVVGVTQDGLPVLGQLPALPQVVFAIGFGSWGQNWSLIAAERLVDWMMEGKEPGILAAERFA